MDGSGEKTSESEENASCKALNQETADVNDLPFSKLIQLKIIVVGDCGVGKTCLIERFTKDAFAELYATTFFEMSHFKIMVDGLGYMLFLYDTSGFKGDDDFRQEKYNGAHCALVCFSIAKPQSLESCKLKWFPEVREHCPNGKVILVGLQSDAREDKKCIDELAAKHEHPVTREEALDLCREVDCDEYIECSAKKSVGVKQVFHKAAEISRSNDNEEQKTKCSIM